MPSHRMPGPGLQVDALVARPAKMANALRGTEWEHRSASEADPFAVDGADQSPEPARVNPASGDIERGFGATPLEEIAAELDRTREEWATGGALFGAGGFANDVRKKMLSIVMLRIRDDILTKGEKGPTDKVLDAMAHADKQYTEWLDRQLIARANWLRLDDTRDTQRERIRRDDALIRSAKSFA